MLLRTQFVQISYIALAIPSTLVYIASLDLSVRAVDPYRMVHIHGDIG